MAQMQSQTEVASHGAALSAQAAMNAKELMERMIAVLDEPDAETQRDPESEPKQECGLGFADPWTADSSGGRKQTTQTLRLVASAVHPPVAQVPSPRQHRHQHRQRSMTTADRLIVMRTLR